MIHVIQRVGVCGSTISSPCSPRQGSGAWGRRGLRRGRTHSRSPHPGSSRCRGCRGCCSWIQGTRGLGRGWGWKGSPRDKTQPLSSHYQLTAFLIRGGGAHRMHVHTHTPNTQQTDTHAHMYSHTHTWNSQHTYTNLHPINI